MYIKVLITYRLYYEYKGCWLSFYKGSPDQSRLNFLKILHFSGGDHYRKLIASHLVYGLLLRLFLLDRFIHPRQTSRIWKDNFFYDSL